MFTDTHTYSQKLNLISFPQICPTIQRTYIHFGQSKQETSSCRHRYQWWYLHVTWTSSQNWRSWQFISYRHVETEKHGCNFGWLVREVEVATKRKAPPYHPRNWIPKRALQCCLSYLRQQLSLNNFFFMCVHLSVTFSTHPPMCIRPLIFHIFCPTVCLLCYTSRNTIYAYDGEPCALFC